MYGYHAVAIASPTASPRGGTEPDGGLYALLFPPPESAATGSGSSRVSFAAACDLLRTAAPINPRGGGATDEQRVVAELRTAWATKFRTPPPAPGDSVAAPRLRELLRELVAARLEAVEGLEVRATRIRGAVLLRLRPSAKLLAATAERLRLPVPVAREVDPGARFWACEVVRERERRVWSRAEAQEELLRLFLAGQLPAEDARVFDDDGEDAAMWSRRLHALRRFSDPAVAAAIAPTGALADDAQPPEVEDTAYLPFAASTALQYLFRQIDGAGSPFRVADRLRLTRALVDEQVNVDALVAAGVLRGRLCLHSRRADAVDTSIDALRVLWGDPLGPCHSLRCRWAPSRPTPRLLALAWRLPAAQPVQYLRNYFGEQIALYFSFASRYALALQALVVLALLLAVLPPSTAASGLVLFAAANAALARVFERKWTLRERKLAAAWGSDLAQATTAHDRRAQFRGRLKRSAVDHRLTPSYPPGRRLIWQVATSVALAALVAALVAANLLLVTSRRFQTFATASRANVSLANLLVAAIARCLASPVLAAAAQALTGWENHKTHESHDASLTLKYALAQAANAFGVLWYMTFMRAAPSDCGRATAGLSCREQAADLLVVTLALDLALALLQLPLSAVASGLAVVVARCSACWRQTSHVEARTSRSPSRPSSLEVEAALPPFTGVLEAYARLILPLGYVAGFAALAPLPATALAWATTLARLRLDALTLAHRVQRPFPRASTTIGRWRAVLLLFSLASAALNAQLAADALTPVDAEADADVDLSSANARAKGVRLALGVGFALLWWLLGLPDPWDRADERRLARAASRREFLRRKYLSALGGVRAAELPNGRVFLSGVARYLVTGDKQEEDAAEELRDQSRGQQRRAREVDKRVAELRVRLGSGARSATRLGALYVEVLGMNTLPPGVDAFVELQTVRSRRRRRRGTDADDDTDAGGDADAEDEPDASSGPEPADGECFNTSVARRAGGRAPQWQEAFELPLESLEHTLELRLMDAAAPLLVSRRKRSRLGVARLAIADIVERCMGLGGAGAGADSPTRAAAAGSDSPKPRTRPSVSALVKLPTAGAPPSPPPRVEAESALPGTVEVPMASYELPLDASDALLVGMRRLQGDPAALRAGHPRLALRCGVRLDELGELLLARRRQRRRLAELRAREAQFLTWADAEA